MLGLVDVAMWRLGFSPQKGSHNSISITMNRSSDVVKMDAEITSTDGKQESKFLYIKPQLTLDMVVVAGV